MINVISVCIRLRFSWNARTFASSYTLLILEPDFPCLAVKIAEPRPDMNIKVVAFKASEKSINTIVTSATSCKNTFISSLHCTRQDCRYLRHWQVFAYWICFLWSHLSPLARRILPLYWYLSKTTIFRIVT